MSSAYPFYLYRVTLLLLFIYELPKSATFLKYFIPVIQSCDRNDSPYGKSDDLHLDGTGLPSERKLERWRSRFAILPKQIVFLICIHQHRFCYRNNFSLSVGSKSILDCLKIFEAKFNSRIAYSLLQNVEVAQLFAVEFNTNFTLIQYMLTAYVHRLIKNIGSNIEQISFYPSHKNLIWEKRFFNLSMTCILEEDDVASLFAFRRHWL